MDGFAVEPLGGEQLHSAVGANDVERADFGHHIGGYQNDDAIESRLGGDGLRHDFAKPPQQQTRSARRAHSESSSRVARPSVGVSKPCNEQAGGPPEGRTRSSGPIVLRLQGGIGMIFRSGKGGRLFFRRSASRGAPALRSGGTGAREKPLLEIREQLARAPALAAATGLQRVQNADEVLVANALEL